MRQAAALAVIGFLLGTGIGVAAQGSISAEVLRLLTRDNTWSGTNTFANTVGVLLQSGSVQASPCTSRLTNVGGNLYFNCVLVATSAGAGTVTSVGLTLPAIFSVAGSPVTSAGTLAVTLATETANTFWAGATSGGASTPTFRAIVDADVPDTITINGTNNVTWASVNKATSSLADLATRSAADLASGTLPDARFPATLPIASGVNLTALNAAALTSGTLPAARMPAMTGDATSSAGTVALTLATTAVTPGAYGDAASTLTATVDSKGRLTALAAIPIVLTGITIPSLAQGDTLFASATNVLTALPKSTTATRYWSNTGASNNPAWAAVNLANGVTGTLAAANGGTSITSVPTNGQLLIGDGAGYTLATLTGTTDQILVANGAGSIVLSLPQSINTTSTPQWLRIGLNTGAGAAARITAAGQFDMGFIDDGNCGATDTIDWNTGEIHKSTLTAATCTLTFNNPIAGRTYVYEVIQDGTGGRLITWPAAVKWTAATPPVLTAGANKIDLCQFLYDGTSYIGRCNLNY